MESARTHGTEAWTERLRETELPVVAGVIVELNRITQSKHASAGKLAEVILKDATLTAQVLKVANNVYYNSGPARSSITTIPRAISQVGFAGIQAIVVSLMFIDSLFRHRPKGRMLHALARSFHAAVQAKDLLQGQNEFIAEDAFTAALLFRLGELAIWTWGGEQAWELDRRLDENELPADELCREVLGSDFKSIGAGLAEAWKMGGTLREALGPAEPKSIAARAVVLGDAIASAAEFGWNSPQFGVVLEQAAEFCGVSRHEMRSRLLKNAVRAGDVAVSFGAARACGFIPSALDQETEERLPIQPDAQHQLNILRQLAELLSSRADINTIFQVALEGMHTGVGLERVALLILNPDRTLLHTKYVLGDRLELWQQLMQSRVDESADSPLRRALDTRMPLWLKPKGATAELYTQDYVQVFGRGAGFIAPIYAGSRSIGVFYADRGGCGELSETQFHNFCHFAQQVNLALSVLASR